jgi:hypothetical protein
VLVKFHNRGVGRGSGPVGYLLGEDQNREKSQLLRGHPDRTKSLIDSLKFKQKYVSGVLSFEESNISDEQKKEIMDGFESALLPNMEGRVDWLWVEHLDKDRLELNFVIPTVDLETGKRLQPYYHKADLNRVDAFKSLTNDIHNFTDPNFPDKSQTMTLNKNENMGRKNLKRSIDQFVASGFENGMINNRSDVINQVKNQGLELTRTTQKSITFLDPDTQQKFRMTGAFYADSFRSREEIQGTDPATTENYKRDREQRIQKNRRRLNEAIKRKQKYLEQRYPRTSRDSDPAIKQRPNENKQFLSPHFMDGGNVDFDSQSVNNVLERVYSEPNNESLPKRKNSDLRKRETMRYRSNSDLQPTNRKGLHRDRSAGDKIDDRARESSNQRVGMVKGTIQRIRETNQRTIQRIGNIGRQINSKTNSFREAGRAVKSNVEKLNDRIRKIRERASRDKQKLEDNNRRHEQLLSTVRHKVSENRKQEMSKTTQSFSPSRYIRR